MGEDGTAVDLLLEDREQPGDDRDGAAAATTALLGALFQLQLAQRKLTADLQARTGLSDSDLIALGVLIRIAPSPVKDIAHALGLTPGSTSTLVDRLTRAGMAVKAPSAEDRRISLVSLTPHGTDLMHGARARYLLAIEQALKDCTAHCLDTTAHVLHGVADGLTPVGATAPTSDMDVATALVVHSITGDPLGAAHANAVAPPRS